MSWEQVGNIRGPEARPGDVAGAPVISVFGRIGAIVATAGDYDAAKVTNAISSLGSYSDPAWLTTLAWYKITGAPAFEQALTFQHSLTRTSNTINLVGDVASPAVSSYYGTNAGGTRGWYALPAAGGVTSFNTRTGAVVPLVGDYSTFYQPLDADLTAIAGLATTPYGRGLLPASRWCWCSQLHRRWHVEFRWRIRFIEWQANHFEWLWHH